MSEREKPFTVNDRRHFPPDGRARVEPPAAPVAGPGAAAAVETAAPVSGERPGTPEAARAEARREAAEPAARGPIDFAHFILSLGAQAGMLLAAEPGGEDAKEALEGARQIVSILEMLQGKTEGRRTDEESRILDDLLYQLRLAYVERAKRP
jgi:hypothetical protein